MVYQGRSVLSAEFQLYRVLPGIGNNSEDLWPVIFWTRMVRLRLLDNYGTVQAAAEAMKGKTGDFALCDVRFGVVVGERLVSYAGRTSVP